MKDKPNYYSIIPSEVRYDEELAPNAKLLYAEITSLTNLEGVCWAGDQYFMKLYNVKRQTIQRWLKQLEDNEYISREVIYKEGTKEIEKRYIKVYTKMLQGYTQNSDKGIHKIVTDNTTSINNTSINNNIVPFKEIIDYLNEKANRQFRLVESNKKFIRARWNEGYTLEDFKQVIYNKASEWLGTDMEKYLQPSTLFGTKFDNYLNQAPKVISKKEAIMPVYKEGEDISQEEAQEIREWIKGLSEN